MIESNLVTLWKSVSQTDIFKTLKQLKQKKNSLSEWCMLYLRELNKEKFGDVKEQGLCVDVGKIEPIGGKDTVEAISKL